MLLTLHSGTPVNGGGGAPDYRVIGGNRNRVPTAFALSGSANVMKYDGLWHAAPKNAATTKARAFFENRYALPNGGNSSTSLVPFKLHASIEYVIISSGAVGLVPFTFSSAANVTLNPGDGLWSDDATIALPAGAFYRLRTDREHLGTAGNYNQLSNVLISSANPIPATGKQDHATSGTDNLVIKSLGGTYPNFSSTTSTYSATLVQLTTSTPGQKMVLLVGDSILRGTGDTAGVTQQGDWLNATSPTQPYVNFGNVGWAETSIGLEYPYFSMAVPSKQVVSSAFNETNLAAQLNLLNESPPTHIVLALGVNDLMQGRTPAQVLADLILAVALLKARYPSAKIYVPTVTPVTNTTDAYATTANQTFTGTPPAGGSVVWSNFDGADDTTGRRKLNADIRSGLVTGADGYIDVALSVQDVADPRKWRVDLGQPTVDGVHPQAVLHRRMAAETGLTSLVSGFTPSDISGLALQFNPAQGMFVERVSPTTPSGNNDPVGTWVAQTGQVATAPSDARRPTYRTGAYPYLAPDAVDDYLVMDAPLSLTGDFTAYFTGTIASGSTNWVPAADTSSDGGFIRFSDNNIYSILNSDVNYFRAYTPPASPQILRVRRTGSTIHVAGLGMAESSASLPGAITISSLLARPARLQFNGNASNRYNDIVIYGRNLTNGEMSLVENYLTLKMRGGAVG